MGVCFAWPLSISGVSCGLSQSAPFYCCPLCRESTTLASLDGRVFLCVTDPLQEGCSACPPGVASSPGCPPGPGASVGFPTSSISLQGNRGKPVVIFLSLSPTYSLRRRNSSKSEARTCYLSVVSGADAGFLRCIPVFLAVGIWRVRGLCSKCSYAVCFYCHRHTYTEIPRTLTPETECLTDFCLAVDLQTSFRFVLCIIRRHTLGRFPSTSGYRTSRGTEDGRGREHQAAGLWSGSQWVEGSHGPSVCAAPGRAWVGSIQSFRKELS